MFNKIEKRTVSRYFLNGKGYANRWIAARALAKHELRNHVGKIVRIDYSELEWLESMYRYEEMKELTRTAWRKGYAEFLGGGKTAWQLWLKTRTAEIVKEQFPASVQAGGMR